MTFSKPYSSKEISQVVERWRPCEFFVMGSKKPIISIAHSELYIPHSWARCRTAAIEKIKTALQQAYDQGIREVGLLCSPYVQEQIILAALSITDDVNWKIYPHTELTYQKNLMAVKGKIWNEAVTIAEAEASIAEMQKEIADSYGFTSAVLEELRQYRHVTDAKQLPEHLRILFRDGYEENE